MFANHNTKNAQMKAEKLVSKDEAWKKQRNSSFFTQNT